ncbi:MAG TPA: restriction endonuclease [Candidatus Paceibacterota bacterium]
MPKSWEENVKEYCEKYNIPVLYLAETLYEPKVVPMIRGKAFEFSVMMALQEILPTHEWIVDKPMINAQIGLHDVDVRVIHKPTEKIIRIECKLAKKGGYRLFPDGHSEIRVKCMRSRTLGSAKVRELAPKLGVSEKVLAVHNDQYLPADFDIVITSIGNAFYATDKKTGLFEWKPSKPAEDFLGKIGFTGKENLRDFAFKTMFAAKTSDLTIGKNGITCTRGLCKNKKACGFIPNYPIITFGEKTNKSTNKWVSLREVSSLFKDLVES